MAKPSVPMKGMKPNIPSLGSGLGNKQMMEAGMQSSRPQMGFGLNLAGVGRSGDGESRGNDTGMVQPSARPGIHSKGLALNFGAVQPRIDEDEEMKNEESRPSPQRPAMGGLKMPGSIPAMKMNDGSKPKMGFGIDLTKAKDIQQRNLAEAEEKKAHARETA